MIWFESKLGKEIELTEERKQHILTFHPEITQHLDKFAQVLLNPDGIRRSISDKKVLLFDKSFASIGSENHLRIAVKTNERWFILTAYLTKRLAGEPYEF